MAGTTKGSDDGDALISDINVTPLVDVMLCLLVIFMVTTSYVVADSLKVDLPEAATGDQTEPSVVMITYVVDQEGIVKLALNTASGASPSRFLRDPRQQLIATRSGSTRRIGGARVSLAY